MDLSFGVSWFCMLLWGCICFPPQTGYSIAHGYNLHKSPQTSSQVIPGESLKPTYVDEIDAIGEQSFVSLQSEPVCYDDWLRFGSVGSFSKEMVQSQPGLVEQGDADESKNGQKLCSRQGKTDKALDKHSFFTKTADFTENIIPSALHGNQVFIQQSAHHPFNGFPAPELLTNNILNNGLPGEHNDFFISVSKNSQAQSGYEQPRQREIPSSVFSGEDSITDHKIGAVFDASNSPSQDFIFFSKKRSSSAPLGYRSKLHRTKYKPVFSSGFDNSKGFHKMGQRHVLSLPKPPSLNYFKPKNQIYVPNYEGKNNKKTFKSFHTYKSRTGKKSKDGGYPPTSTMKVNPESDSNSKFLFPHLGLGANKPQKEQARSHLALNVKPSSPLHGSGGRSNHLEHLRFNSGPFILAAHPENKEKSFRYEPNKKDYSQHKDMHSIQKKIQPQTRLGSFSAQDRFLFLNGGYEDAMKAGLLKPMRQPDSIQMLSDTMKTDPTNFASWPSELFSEPKDVDLNCIIWKNTKNSYPPRSQKSARSFVNAYIKSKNRSARATTFLYRTCYKPFQRTRLISGNGNLS